MAEITYDHDKATATEFRANEGKVGGFFEGMPLVLLHHVGAKSGIERINPLATQATESGWAIFASKGGADENPAWYYNLLANPETTVEFETETYAVRAREAIGPEHDRIWTKQKTDYPGFAEYEKMTKRERIPVVVLERV